ncbi:extracellular solute-binding protein [Georgenia subflava]|uniref:Extracellular solute-binding protein n=1 Tax=Georgenia subflava TaxID=1622177 RepID=A0A6N7EC80_9MICO|nr:extracellular solute-binding protein [Georgenia subflava]MPV35580.1 extracellular solute-binding protein [Georgenia subflava]
MRHVIRNTSVLALASTLALAGCSSSGDDEGDGGETGGSEAETITVMYQRTEGITALDELFNQIKPEFEAAHEGVTVELTPIEAAEDDYATQLALSHQSADTAPDVFYEDTFRVRSDVEAGYLLNLDDYVAEWEDWEQFNEGARGAGRGDDGSIYAIPLGTDTRGIFYSEPLLEAVGVELPWQPESWQDILDTAEQIKTHDPDVVPFHMYAGKPAGEGTLMQSFLPLMYGTEDRLYDEESQTWNTGTQGFEDALTFLDTLYDDGYAVPVEEALDANLWQTIFDTRLPDAQLGGVVEGSYGSSFWEESGPFPWPEYADDIGVAAFPTQNGQAPGKVSMSGGWTLAVGAQSEAPDLAFEFLAMAMNFENSLAYTIQNSQIAVRDDVAADASYLEANPYVEFFTDLVEVTHFRPATADYPRISAAIQEATEQVVTGAAEPAEAAAAYDDALVGIVGDDGVSGS